jgi:hypothetical protein
MCFFLDMVAFREPETGTWLVKAVTETLDTLEKDVDLLTFLTCVQNRIAYQKKIYHQLLRGQTPELRVFPIPPISILSSHNATPCETSSQHPKSTL